MTLSILMLDHKTDPGRRLDDHELGLPDGAPIKYTTTWDDFQDELRQDASRPSYDALLVHTTDVWLKWHDHSEAATDLARALDAAHSHVPVVLFTGAGWPDVAYQTALVQSGRSGPVRICEYSEFRAIVGQFLETRDISVLSFSETQASLDVGGALQAFTWQWELATRNARSCGKQTDEHHALKTVADGLLQAVDGGRPPGIGMAVALYVAEHILGRETLANTREDFVKRWAWWIDATGNRLQQLMPRGEIGGETLAADAFMGLLSKLADSKQLCDWYAGFRTLMRLLFDEPSRA